MGEFSVYMIKAKDPNNTATYIGKTNDLGRREYNHRANCVTPTIKHYNYFVYEFIREFGGFDNFMMLPIKSNLEAHEATQLEQNMIKELRPYLNKVVPGRTQKEYREEFAEDIRTKSITQNYLNKEKQKEKWNKWNALNREYINARMRENYRKNKKLIQIKDKTKYWCVCGKHICHRNRRGHLLTATHTDGLNKFQNELKERKKEILHL